MNLKNNIHNKVIFLFILFALLFPSSVYGQETGTVKCTDGVTDGAIYVDLSAGRIVDVDWEVTEIVIPDEVNGVKITSIDSSALTSTNLQKLTISKNIRNLGENENSSLWMSCNNLKEIQVSESNSFYSSKNGVLYNKSGTELLKYPEGKKSKTFSVPAGVKTIGEKAFYNSYLEKLSLPYSISSFPNYNFERNDKIIEINVSAKNKWYTSVDGVVFDKEMEKLLIYPKGRTQSRYSVPDGVGVICEEAFCHSTLKEIKLPDSISEIERTAFFGCRNLEKINIPRNVKKIGEYAFSYCGSLEKLNIPQSVKKIGTDRIPQLFQSSERINTVIYCTAGSYAESYAKNQQLNYRSLKKPILNADAHSGGRITLTWNEVNYAEKYQIHIYDSVKKKYVLKKTNDADTLSATHKGLKKGKTYRYKIRACCTINGERVYSPYSAVKTVKAK